MDPVLKAAREAREAETAAERAVEEETARAAKARQDEELWRKADRIIYKRRGEDKLEKQVFFFSS